MQSVFRIALAILIACPSAWGQVTTASTRNDTIIKLIDILRTEQDPGYRYMVAGILPQLVEWGKPDTTNPIVIDALARLLTDSADAIRANAAAALGLIGPPASRTVPLLVDALRRAEAEFIRPGQLRPSSFSGDEICMALQQIGMPLPDAPCRNGYYFGGRP
jgi:hypothetical protein